MVRLRNMTRKENTATPATENGTDTNLSAASKRAVEAALRRSAKRQARLERRDATLSAEMATAEMIRGERVAARAVLQKMQMEDESSASSASEAEETAVSSETSAEESGDESEGVWEVCEAGQRGIEYGDARRAGRLGGADVVVEHELPTTADAGEDAAVVEISNDESESSSAENDARRKRLRKKTRRVSGPVYNAAQRAAAAKLHELHALCCLASLMELDRVADEAEMQSRMRAAMPPSLMNSFAPWRAGNAPADKPSASLQRALRAFCLWFASTFRLMSATEALAQRAAVAGHIPRTARSRIMAAAALSSGTEQELATVAVAALRVLVREADDADTPPQHEQTITTCSAVRVVNWMDVISRKPVPEFFERLPHGAAHTSQRLAEMTDRLLLPSGMDEAVALQPPLNVHKPGAPFKMHRQAAPSGDRGTRRSAASTPALKVEAGFDDKNVAGLMQWTAALPDSFFAPFSSCGSVRDRALADAKLEPELGQLLQRLPASLRSTPFYWLEVWHPNETRWVPVDPIRCLVDDPLAVSSPSALTWRMRRATPAHSRTVRSKEAAEQKVPLSSSSTTAMRPTRSGRARPIPQARPPKPADESDTDSTLTDGVLPTASDATAHPRSSRHPDERVPLYIVASASGFVRDVTRRYVSRFQPVLQQRTLEGHRHWTEDVLPQWESSHPPPAVRHLMRIADERERDHFYALHETEPIPPSRAALRNHPAYALEEHLKKYQAIYPRVVVGTIPAVQPDGSVGACPVYRRRDVHLLHTRERWFRECRVVRDGEQPYKVVESFMSRMRQLRDARRRGGAAAPADSSIQGEPSELYGRWQTEEMPRAVARDGIVPRIGPRGNIELWTERHLPVGTVHVHLPFAGMLARRLGIDAVPAMTGFEVKRCGSVPVIQGVVVCTEHAAALMDACHAEVARRQARAERRLADEALQRWRKLVRTIVAKERLRRRYGGFAVQDTNARFSSARGRRVTSASSAASRKPSRGQSTPGDQRREAEASTPTDAAAAPSSPSKRSHKASAHHRHSWSAERPCADGTHWAKSCTTCGVVITFEKLL